MLLRLAACGTLFPARSIVLLLWMGGLFCNGESMSAFAAAFPAAVGLCGGGLVGEDEFPMAVVPCTCSFSSCFVGLISRRGK
ncbi:hypothetical protein BX661DRAFT_189172 [Kickxella alabastrina]|uniref:uncharacterized protein n=1 Tax=Kickxella alabastrina TaxID=61397 RepID=UPI002220DA72|nr:uncharacterized protein BX661DRAFT_189172 [Kickxella alabastrina]KAI7820489.1 hypothetical protein BX661DRAFT_189172 [Kickxella alabastrina]